MPPQYKHPKGCSIHSCLAYIYILKTTIIGADLHWGRHGFNDIVSSIFLWKYQQNWSHSRGSAYTQPNCIVFTCSHVDGNVSVHNRCISRNSAIQHPLAEYYSVSSSWVVRCNLMITILSWSSKKTKCKQGIEWYKIWSLLLYDDHQTCQLYLV